MLKEINFNQEMASEHPLQGNGRGTVPLVSINMYNVGVGGKIYYLKDIKPKPFKTFVWFFITIFTLASLYISGETSKVTLLQSVTDAMDIALTKVS